MDITVFIKRIYECSSKEKKLLTLIRKIRTIVPLQSGYISSKYVNRIDPEWDKDLNEWRLGYLPSKYVNKIDPPKEIVAISTWESLDDWQRWYESEERREIQSKIDATPGVKTEYEIYEDTKFYAVPNYSQLVGSNVQYKRLFKQLG